MAQTNIHQLTVNLSERKSLGANFFACYVSIVWREENVSGRRWREIGAEWLFLVLRQKIDIKSVLNEASRLLSLTLSRLQDICSWIILLLLLRSSGVSRETGRDILSREDFWSSSPLWQRNKKMNYLSEEKALRWKVAVIWKYLMCWQRSPCMSLWWKHRCTSTTCRSDRQQSTLLCLVSRWNW